MLTKIDVPINYAPKVCVYLRGKKWYWKYQLPNGKFHFCAISEDEKLAKRNAKLKAKDLAKGFFTDEELTKLQKTERKSNLSNSEVKEQQCEIDLYIHEYIEAKSSEPGITARYIDDEKTLLIGCMRFFKELETLKIKSISGIRSKHIWKYRDFLLSQVKAGKLKPISASNNLNCVKRFFKSLKKRQEILVDPSFVVDHIKVDQKTAVRKVALPKDTISRINNVEYNHPHELSLKELVCFLLITGARFGEATHAEVSDFDLENGIWRLREKPRCPTLYGMGWKPKNGKERNVPLTDKATSLVGELIRKAQERQIVGYIRNQEKPVAAQFIFTMIDQKLSPTKKEIKQGSNKPIVWRRVDSAKKSWKSLFIKAGLCVPDISKEGQFLVQYTRHDARRRWNQNAEELGLDIKERSAILGHEPKVNKSNYNGETYVDLDSITKRLNDGYCTEKPQNEVAERSQDCDSKGHNQVLYQLDYCRHKG